MKKLFLVTIICSNLFALAGFGAYGDFDLLKYPSSTSGDITQTGVKSEGFSNAKGFGL